MHFRRPMRTAFDRTNAADIACQRLSQGRNLPTNTRDPPKLINNNELRAGFSNTKYTSGTRIGNWFEQRVIESGCKQGASPAIAPFETEIPFQKPGEQSLFFNRQGRYVTEYTQKYILNPEYVGPAAESKQASASCIKASMESHPEMDSNRRLVSWHMLVLGLCGLDKEPALPLPRGSTRCHAQKVEHDL